ncbi:MAG: PfkB family carbohydrate kinase [Sedimentisphaerales bacterium]
MSERNPKVVVVGSAYVDLAIKCAETPTAGQTTTGTALSLTATGPGVNQAIEAALCGCEVHLVSKISNCPLGATIKAILEQYEVNTKYIFTAQAKNTGVILTLVDTKGENTCVQYDGANSALVPADIELAERAIAEADVCLIHARLPKEAVVKAISIAKLHGKKVIFDPAGVLGPSSPGVETSLPAEYFSVDVMIPNLYEASLISEHSSANIRTAKMVGSDLVARGAAAAVITMGRRGCMVVDRDNADHIPAYPINLVDHTGTGDAFAGALAAALAVGDDLRKAVRFASAAGALACTKFGSVDAMPVKSEIIELMQKQEPE